MGKEQSWLKCIDAAGKGDITSTGERWSYPMAHHCCSTPAIADGLLFITDCATCFTASMRRPEPHWTHKLKREIWGLALVADGKCTWVPTVATSSSSAAPHEGTARHRPAGCAGRLHARRRKWCALRDHPPDPLRSTRKPPLKRHARPLILAGDTTALLHLTPLLFWHAKCTTLTEVQRHTEFQTDRQRDKRGWNCLVQRRLRTPASRWNAARLWPGCSGPRGG